MHAITRFAFSVSLLAPVGAALAEDVNVGTTLPRFTLVKEGTHRYLRFMKQGEASMPGNIWTRIVSVEQVDGKRQLRIRQRWDGAGPTP